MKEVVPAGTAFFCHFWFIKCRTGGLKKEDSIESSSLYSSPLTAGEAVSSLNHFWDISWNVPSW